MAYGKGPVGHNGWRAFGRQVQNMWAEELKRMGDYYIKNSGNEGAKLARRALIPHIFNRLLFSFSPVFLI